VRRNDAVSFICGRFARDRLFGLGRLGGPEAVATLEAIHADDADDDIVKLAAWKALRRITRRVAKVYAEGEDKGRAVDPSAAGGSASDDDDDADHDNSDDEASDDNSDDEDEDSDDEDEDSDDEDSDDEDEDSEDEDSEDEDSDDEDDNEEDDDEDDDDE